MGDPARRSRCRRAARRGFSLIELLIVIALLATALSVLFGTMASLKLAQDDARETARAHVVAQGLAERVLGGSWDLLGKEPWSRQRREDPANPDHVPLSEGAADDADDLIDSGVLTQRSGLNGVKVYLEYYPIAIWADTGTAAWQTAPGQVWNARRLDAANQSLPRDINGDIDLRTVNAAVAVRVAVAWDGAGGPRHYELVLARRR